MKTQTEKSIRLQITQEPEFIFSVLLFIIIILESAPPQFIESLSAILSNISLRVKIIQGFIGAL